MTHHRTKRPDYLPARLHFDIGGFIAECHEVHLQDGHLRYRRAPGAYAWSSETLCNPDEKQWEEFWRAVDTAGAWDWARQYVNPGVCDGTQWSLNMKHKGRSVRSEGSNAYPGGAEMDCDLPAAGSFAQFLHALRLLCGGKITS